MKQVHRSLLFAAIAAITLGMSMGAIAQSSQDKSPPKKVSKAKASYIVGWGLGNSVNPLVRKHVDPDLVAKAVKAALSGKKPQMSEEQLKEVSKNFRAELTSEFKAKRAEQATENKEKGAAFLAKNKKAPGVHTTASGLEYKVLESGKGPRPGPSDTVRVEYVGTLLNGDKFDASADHPKPESGKSVPIPLAKVIPGFREGLQLMQVGSHYKFWIPASLAYGSNPPNGAFPPNATLVFDVKLKDTKATPDSDDSDPSNS